MIRGSKTRLRALKRNDLSHFVRWINDPETRRQAMLGWAFNYLNLNRISLSVYAYNERDVHCYQKYGFQHEGTMRQARYADGQYHDELVMGVLRDEFLSGNRETAQS